MLKMKCIKKILLILLSLSVLIFIPSAEDALGSSVNKKTIRVGIPDAETNADGSGENQNTVFEKQYLQAIAEYADWDYTYVMGSWGECLEMAENGEIDLLMGVTKSTQRENYFDYSAEAMGTEMCCLIGREDTELTYNDYKGFNGITVGYEDGSMLISSFENYAEEMGFQVHEKGYSRLNDMYADLESGKITAALQSNFFEVPEHDVILAKLDPEPVYIVTNKRIPELEAELNSAMEQLFSYSPNFNSDLYQKIFTNNFSQSVSYSEEERRYLSGHPVVLVPYETNWEPFEYEKDGEPEGITPDVIRAVSKDTGIQFKFIKSSSTQAIYNSMGTQVSDMIMAISYDYLWAARHDLMITQPYVNGSVMKVSKDGSAQPESVAVVEGGYLANEISNAYPELSAVKFDTFNECMKAVADGKADCTFLNYYQATYFRSLNANEYFSYQPVTAITQGLSLGVTKDSNPLLYGIISKSLQRVSRKVLPDILSEDTVVEEPLSLDILIKRHPGKMAAIIGGVGILIGLLIVMFLTAGFRKKQNLALARAKKEAEDANQAKTNFFSRMSHDIRTPLNGIIGMTGIASEQDNPERTRDCLDKIETSGKFLLGLVNDIMDISTAESGKQILHPEPYSYEKFEKYIDAVIKPLCDDRRQTLEIIWNRSEEIVPVIDVLGINKIYFNLLSNAAKYTQEGGKIEVRIDEEKLSDHQMKIVTHIRDNGIGMSEDFQKILFEPFTREQRDETAQMHGTGLGMSIVRKTIDEMHGRISVKSKLHEGTEFWFEIAVPYVARGSEVTASMPDDMTAKTELKDARLLVCEDNPLNQEIIQAILEEAGCKVTMAENGKKGLNLFAVSTPGYYQAVLMDIQMPVMDGMEAARQIRSLDRSDAKTVPILAMTADVFEESKRAAEEAGMNGYVIKPIDTKALYQMLAENIRKIRLKKIH